MVRGFSLLCYVDSNPKMAKSSTSRSDLLAVPSESDDPVAWLDILRDHDIILDNKRVNFSSLVREHLRVVAHVRGSTRILFGAVF